MLTHLQQSIRSAARRPAFIVPVIVTLSLGMAATITVFSVIDSLLLRPVPGIRDASRVATVSFSADGSSLGVSTLTLRISLPVFSDLVARVPRMEQAAAVETAELTVGGDGDRTAERVSGALVTASYFTMLGATAVAGRLPVPAEMGPGAAPVAVISEHLWRTRYGADPGVIGSTVRFGRVPFTIVGIAGDGFRGDRLEVPVDVFLPINEHGAVAAGYALPDLAEGSLLGRLLVRLPDVAASESLERELEAAVATLAAESAGELRYVEQVDVVPGLGLRDPLRSDLERHAVTLSVLVLLVLLATCGNAAYMFLARSTERRHEIAVRRALGAGTSRIIMHLLAECVLVAAAAAMIGLVLAQWAVDLLEGATLMPGLQPLGDVPIDLRVATFAAALIVVTICVFGAAPAWFAASVGVTESFRGAQAGRRREQTRLHALAVGAQIAIAMLLTVSAALVVRSLSNIASRDLGFETRSVLTMAIEPEPRVYIPGGRGDRFWRELTERVRALPGVTHASFAGDLPLTGSARHSRITVPGADLDADDVPVIPGAHVGEDWFDAMAIDILAGRTFEAGRDTAAIIVNEALATMLWPSVAPLSAIGRQVISNGEPRRVVGVVESIASIDPASAPTPQWYEPPRLRLGGFLVVRTASGESAGVIAGVRAVLSEIDADVAAFDVATMEQRVDVRVADARMLGAALVGFGGFVIVLAFLGLYGLLSYVVGARRTELAVRSVLGADRHALMRLVLWDAAPIAVGGMIAGLLLSLAATDLIRGLLYGVPALDPLTYGAAAASLLLLTALAATVPALRALRTSPAAALRE